MPSLEPTGTRLVMIIIFSYQNKDLNQMFIYCTELSQKTQAMRYIVKWILVDVWEGNKQPYCLLNLIL